jgi:hypothetical protein
MPMTNSIAPDLVDLDDVGATGWASRCRRAWPTLRLVLAPQLSSLMATRRPTCGS